MIIKELDKEKFLTTIIHDPSPHRFDPDSTPIEERQKPIIYTCENCNYKISFKIDSFEKHCNSSFSNLKPEELKLFEIHRSKDKDSDLSFLDFYCPECKQPTYFLFLGGPSGYWGYFSLEIKKLLVLKK